VVERPASVVKELVENALDAGAGKIEIHLRDSGRTEIRVLDDGSGMSEAEVSAALERHATSKIRSTEDLAAVRTLGFRGEALPSIASVSRLTLSSGTSDGLRTTVRAEAGQVTALPGRSGPRGTEIVVEDLFYNTPARLKFLKSDTTELGQAIEHISRYAIAYPEVAFTMTHSGQLALRTTGGGNRLEAISDVWGRETAKALASVSINVAGLRIEGYVSPPHFTKSSRSYQYVYVNGRPVRTRTLTAAIDQSFRDITPERRYPLMVLMIGVDPSRVDVNVSPTKSEVKFQNEGAAFDAIRVAVKSALMEHGMIPDASAVAAANEALAMTRPANPWSAVPTSAEPDPFENLQRTFGASNSWPATEATETLELGATPFRSLLDKLRVIGQVMNTFIVAETARGVVIIDQHVAHERVLYEYLCGLKGAGSIEKQVLLVPQILHLDRRSSVLLRDRLGEIAAVGFDLEPFGGESYAVRAVPAAIRSKDPLKILRDLVDELVESSVTRKLVPTREQIWITSACHMAVKAGDPLSIPEMEKLIEDLATTENPYLCPHGRPITVTLSKDSLLRMFKRT
jgi:DNA mismatch repair protein MutL